MNPSDTPSVVEITGLNRQFGSTLALNQVSLQVRRGRVFGLVGTNGAGKTTLIKHVLGRLKAQSGEVRVFGFDPVADPVAVLEVTTPASAVPPIPNRTSFPSMLLPD